MRDDAGVDVVRVSKRLSFVLRHRPDSVGLSLDDAGWVRVEELLAVLAAVRASHLAVVD